MAASDMRNRRHVQPLLTWSTNAAHPTGSTTQWQADLAPKEMVTSDIRNRRHVQPLLTWSTNAAHPTGSTTQWQADLAPKEMAASGMRNRRHVQLLLTWSTNAAHPEIEQCYYHATIKDYPGAISALRTCNGVSGIIHVNNDTFVIHPFYGGDLSRKHPHIIYRTFSEDDEKPTCGNNNMHEWGFKHFRIRPPKIKRDIRQVNKYIELALVIDQAMVSECVYILNGLYIHGLLVVQFENRNATRQEVVHDAIQIINCVDMYFRTLNTRVAVVYVETWSHGDQIIINSDVRQTLLNFMEYSSRKLYKQAKDASHLITGHHFNSRQVGMAVPDTICTAKAVAVSEDYNIYEPHLVASTVTHMLGHNVGMSHDHPDDCKCQDWWGCIMTPSILGHNNIQPYHFSSCSNEDYIKALRNGHGICLFNPPNQLEDFRSCGNGIVEEDEQCDCGHMDECRQTDPCCDPITCKLLVEAECSTGPCCENCKLRSSGYLCRAPRTECDIPEYCNGLDGQCPPDVYKKNGNPCNSGTGYCFHGNCPTTSSQCEFIWGSGALTSDTKCFTQYNTQGSLNGNCGPDGKGGYIKCTEDNVLCGSLQCQKGSRTPLLEGMDKQYSHTVMSINGREYECKIASGTLPSQSEITDMGMVFDGTKCDESKICVNQTCVYLQHYIEPGSCPTNNHAVVCSSHGVCSNRNQCFCHPGWTSNDCSVRLEGGEQLEHLSTPSGATEPNWKYNTPRTIKKVGKKGKFTTASLVIVLCCTVGGVFIFFTLMATCYRRKNILPLKELSNMKKRLVVALTGKKEDDMSGPDTRIITFGPLPSYRLRVELPDCCTDWCQTVVQGYVGKCQTVVQGYVGKCQTVVQGYVGKCQTVVQGYVGKCQAVVQGYVGKCQAVVQGYVGKYQVVVQGYVGKCQAVVQGYVGKCQAVVQDYVGNYQNVVQGYVGKCQAVVQDYVGNYQTVVQGYVWNYQTVVQGYVWKCQAVVQGYVWNYQNVVQGYVWNYQTVVQDYVGKCQAVCQTVVQGYVGKCQIVVQGYVGNYQTVVQGYVWKCQAVVQGHVGKLQVVVQGYVGKCQAVVQGYVGKCQTVVQGYMGKCQTVVQGYVGKCQTVVQGYMGKCQTVVQGYVWNYQTVVQGYVWKCQAVVQGHVGKLQVVVQGYVGKCQAVVQGYVGKCQTVVQGYMGKCQTVVQGYVGKCQTVVQGYMGKCQTVVQGYVWNYQTVVQGYVWKCQAVVQGHVGKLQVVVQGYVGKCQAVVQGYVGKCQTVVQGYMGKCQAVVQGHVGKCQAVVQGHVGKCQAVVQGYVGKYQAVVQGYVGKCQAVVQGYLWNYQTVVQGYVGKCQAVVQGYVWNYQTVVQGYVGKCQAVVQGYVWNYQAVVQGYVGKCQAVVQGYLWNYQTVVQGYVGKCQAVVQGYLWNYQTVVQGYVGKCQAVVQGYLWNYQTVVQGYVGKCQAVVQGYLWNYQAVVQGYVGKCQAVVQGYLWNYQTVVQGYVGKCQAVVQGYVGKYQAVVQGHVGKCQAVVQGYCLLKKKIDDRRYQYLSTFLTIMVNVWACRHGAIRVSAVCGSNSNFSQEQDDKPHEKKHHHDDLPKDLSSEEQDLTENTIVELSPDNLGRIPERGILKQGGSSGRSPDFCHKETLTEGNNGGYHEEILEALQCALETKRKSSGSNQASPSQDFLPDDDLTRIRNLGDLMKQLEHQPYGVDKDRHFPPYLLDRLVPSSPPYHPDDDTDEEDGSTYSSRHLVRSASEEALPVTPKPANYVSNTAVPGPGEADFYTSPPSDNGSCANSSEENAFVQLPQPPPSDPKRARQKFPEYKV
ncbi:ADAM22 [Cordylochernes scorpioides]|uniref:ADAM22 n=1 Tax=Cordylochernes scorpioides TaxID=51811 RepID=A0ABY6K6A3_9ARAC|nr:ADAM22 [Cordylochernes scorpioides]